MEPKDFDFEGTYDEHDKLVSQTMIFRLSVTMRPSGELRRMYPFILIPNWRVEVGEYQRFGFCTQDERLDFEEWAEMDTTIV